MKQHAVVHEAIWAPIIVGAFAAARWFPFAQFPLPCPFRSITGIPCPTCGGTRAMVAMAHFDLPRAIEMNPLVALLAVLALAYVVHAVRVLATKRPWRPRIPAAIRPVAIAALAINWGYLIAVGR